MRSPQPAIGRSTYDQRWRAMPYTGTRSQPPAFTKNSEESGGPPDAQRVCRQGERRCARQGGRHGRCRCGQVKAGSPGHRKRRTGLACFAQLAGGGLGCRIVAAVACVICIVRCTRHGHALFHGAGWFKEACARHALKSKHKTHPKNQQGTHGRILCGCAPTCQRSAANSYIHGGNVAGPPDF